MGTGGAIVIFTYFITRMMAMDRKNTGDKADALTIQALQRMPYYLHCLEKAKAKGETTISATSIANELKLNDVLVRKDIAAVCSTKGKPKSGFPVDELISDIEDYMGINDRKEAIIVGAGSLGRALLGNREFEEYGLSITAAFDINKDITGRTVNNIPILDLSEMEPFCREHGIPIGIITAPMDAAQEIADALVRCGIRAIWNFALVRLNVPEGVLVQNENLASSLAMLSHHITK